MNAPLRVAIADDEPLARRRIARLLDRDASIEIVAICENSDQLLQQLRTQPVDAVFLDIEMPGGDGFSALANLPPPLPRVVFVTAYSQHACRAFDIDATDYLVKPVSQERLLQAVDRVRRDIAATPRTKDRAPAHDERMTFVVGHEVRRLQLDDIDHIIAQANYLEVRSGHGHAVTRRSISQMEAQLDPARFLRIHRSHIVRIASISKIETMPYGRFRFTLRNGDRVLTGRSYRDRIRKTLGIDEEHG